MELLAVLVCHLLIVDAACVPEGFGPAPVSLDDCRRFPDHATATRLADAARWHYERCCQHRPLSEDDRAWYAAAEKEAYRVWWLLDDVRLASSPVSGDDYRLDVLRRVREQLGEEGWHAGTLPPPVPLWAVRR
jgi:hypothetical protein